MRSPMMIIVVGLVIILLILAVLAVVYGSGTPAPATVAATTAAGETVASSPTSAAAPDTPTPALSPTGVAAAPTTAPAAQTTTAPAAQTTTATALSKLNLRGGPGTNYPVVGSLAAQESATVTGRSEDGAWLVVETGDGPVWLTADSSLVKVDGRPVADLPVVEAPRLTYDASNPKVALLLNQIPLVLHNPGSFTCVSHNGLNNLASLAEGNVIGPHAGDFVYGNDNVLFKYHNGSLQLIKENPIARFDGGAESLPFDKAMQLFASGEIIWTGQLGQSPGRGVTGCDPAAK